MRIVDHIESNKHRFLIKTHTHRKIKMIHKIRESTYLLTKILCLCDIHIGRQTDRQTDGQTDRQTNRQTDRRTDGQTDRQTDRRTDGQADRQTDRLTYGQNLLLIM